MKTVTFPTPFFVGDEAISGAEIANIGFGRFVAIARQVLPTVKPGQKFNVLMQRHRLMEQVTLVTAGGKRMKLTEDQVLALPPMVGRDLVEDLFFIDDGVGELLSGSSADGVSVPFHYKLGTPIKGQGGKDITEIEFIAKSFGDLEELTAETFELGQAYDLITKMGKPLGEGVTLLAMPSWAVDQVSLMDGLFIMNQVLPRFLK